LVHRVGNGHFLGSVLHILLIFRLVELVFPDLGANIRALDARA